MSNFLLLATAWGPKFGGINAFNMDFAIGLAKHLGKEGKVFCAAFRPSREDFESASSGGVHLLGIDRPEDSPPTTRAGGSMFGGNSNPNIRSTRSIGGSVTM